MTHLFRLISFLEGLSYLIILCVTVGIIGREYVSVLGMSHGVLFTVYVLGTFLISYLKKLPLLVWLGLFLASLIPFAFIGVELYFRKKISNA